MCISAIIMLHVYNFEKKGNVSMNVYIYNKESPAFEKCKQTIIALEISFIVIYH